MSRVAQVLKSKVTLVVAVVVLAVGGTGLAVYLHDHSGNVQTISNSQHQLTQISYDGKDGATALDLLKKYATVQTKHYSFGDLVTSVNGVSGNGPKYWTFYLNGKEATVGAGSYVSKNSDKISWKLQ